MTSAHISMWEVTVPLNTLKSKTLTPNFVYVKAFYIPIKVAQCMTNFTTDKKKREKKRSF